MTIDTINDGGPAFPLKEPLTRDFLGMSLRDYFAAHAMTAIVSLDRTYKAETAEIAYGIADAMLAARDKK